MGCKPQSLLPDVVGAEIEKLKEKKKDCETAQRASGETDARIAQIEKRITLLKTQQKTLKESVGVAKPTRTSTQDISSVIFDTQALYADTCKASCETLVKMKAGETALLVSDAELVLSAAKRFINGRIRPLVRTRNDDSSSLTIYLVVEEGTSAVKYAAAKKRNVQAIRELLRAAAQCHVLEDYYAAEKRLVRLVRPALLTRVTEKVLELVRKESSLNVKVEVVNCGLIEADEKIQEYYFQGKIEAFVSTDLDISAARSVPRLIIGKNGGLTIENGKRMHFYQQRELCSQISPLSKALVALERLKVKANKRRLLNNKENAIAKRKEYSAKKRRLKEANAAGTPGTDEEMAVV